MFESKLNRGKANGYAPLDSSGKVPSDKLPAIQSIIDTGSFATTGSNTFVGNQIVSGSITTTTGTVQGTGSLYLQPDANDARYFQIYNTSPTDTHIKASGGLSYFGDDTNYLLIDDGNGDLILRATNDVTIQTGNGDIVLNPDGNAYIGSANSGNGIVTDGYLGGVIGDTSMVNNSTGHTITDNLTNIIDSIPAAVNTASFATTGSNSFNGNQSITGSLNIGGPLAVTISTGVPNGVSNWNGQGGWNQGYYSNITASGGTGTGLTVNVAAGGGGYININAISINTPGSGYTSGDIVTINNENNLPGQFTIQVASTDVLQCDTNGNLILTSNNVPANLSGSIGDVEGTLRIGQNSIYFASQSFVPETYQIIVNPGATYNTHVSIPKNQPGIPNLYSNGFTITTQDDTTYTLTGVYTDGDTWDCEIDSLNSNYNGGTQTMTLTWLDWQPATIWKKTDFGFEVGKFVENAATSSIIKRTSVPTSLTGSEGDKNGMIAFNSGAIYFANESYYGPGPYTSSLYQETSNSSNFPLTKGNYPKPKVGWSITVPNVYTATITNVEDLGNYWLAYTAAGNTSVSPPVSITLDTNGLLDNVWLKQEFISSSIVDSLNSKTGSYTTTGSNTFIGTETISGSLGVSGSSIFNGSQIVTGSTRGNVTALSTTSNTASVDLGTGNYFTLQLIAGTNTYINPSNILPGQTSIIAISTTGSATVSFPATVKQPSGSSYVPTAATGVDIVTLASVNSSTLYVVSVKNMI